MTIPVSLIYNKVCWVGGKAFPTTPQSMTLPTAVKMLIEQDQWGGRLSGVIESDGMITITTRTPGWNAVDVVSYTGDVEEMRVLVRFAELLNTLQEPRFYWPKVFKQSFGPPSLYKEQSRRAMVLVVLLEHYKECQDSFHAALKMAEGLGIDDVVAAHELARCGDCSLIDAFRLGATMVD